MQGEGALFGLDNKRISFDVYPFIYASIHGNLDVKGEVYANNISSDRRLKKNIKDSEANALNMIKQIKHRQFEMKENNKHYDIGYIAQEMEEIDANFVLKREKTEKSDERYYINELPIIATLSKAIQEQQEEIENLTARLDKLEKEVLNEKD